MNRPVDGRKKILPSEQTFNARLSRRIQEHWAEQGFPGAVEVYLEQIKTNPPIYVLASNMVNGLPPREYKKRTKTLGK